MHFFVSSTCLHGEAGLLLFDPLPESHHVINGTAALWDSTTQSGCHVRNSAGAPKGKKAITETDAAVGLCQQAFHHCDKLLS